MRRPRRGRALASVAAVAAILAGTFGGGVVTGRSLAPTDAAATEAEVVLQVSPYGDGAEAAMPDVRGLPEDAAREALADAGIPLSVLTVERRPAAGTPGSVVAQTPAFGAAKPDRVVLVLADPAQVPAGIGQPQAQVTRQVQELGARVVIERRFELGKEAGQVLALSPEPGEPLGSEVVVTVAEAPSALFLDAVDAEEGSCSTGTVRVDGADREHSVSCDLGDEPTVLVYLVDRAAASLAGTIGVPDDADPASRVLVEVIADGASVAKVEAAYGKPAPIAANLGSALRLEFRITRLGPGVTPEACCPEVSAVLADLQLVGGPERITALEARDA